MVYPLLQIEKFNASHEAMADNLGAVLNPLISVAAVNYAGFDYTADNLIKMKQVIENGSSQWKEYSAFTTQPKVSPILDTDGIRKLGKSGVKFHIEAAQYDPLLDENIEYSKLLQNAGANVDMNISGGTTHCGIMVLSPTANSMKVPIFGKITPQHAYSFREMLDRINKNIVRQ